MNLFIRFAWLWLCLVVMKKPFSNMNGAIQQSYRILPHDMGWRLHLPNFRFFSFMELGRFEFWYVSHKFHEMSPGSRLIAAQELVYIRPVSHFALLHSDTVLLFWDDKYVYFQHNFYVKGTLVATGLVKEACLRYGRVQSPVSIFGECRGSDMAVTTVEHWQALQQSLRQLSQPN